MFEHVAAKRIVRVCEPPNSANRPRLAPQGRHSGVAFSLVTFLLDKQEKVTCRRATPGLLPSIKPIAISAVQCAALIGPNLLIT